MERYLSVSEMPMNSVDVLGVDGLYRYGSVVDVADNGLFIDLYCEGRRRELVPFDSVFRSASPPLTGKDLAQIFAAAEMTTRVDVRMRHSPADPWIWYPAEVFNLAHGVQHVAYDVAVVRWCNKEACTDIVPVERIRRSVWSSDLSQVGAAGAKNRVPVSKWTFVKGSAPLPPRLASISPAAAQKLVRKLNELRYLWDNDSRPILVIEAKDGQLFYLEKRSSEYELDADAPCFDECWTDYEGTGYTFSAEDHDMKESVTDETGNKTMDDGDISALTTNVLLEIFSHLSTVTQILLRKVCAAWNYIITELTTCIIIGGQDDDTDELYSDYILTAPVFKCLRVSTRYIVVDCRELLLEGDDFLKVFQMIHYIAQQREKIHLSTIFLLGLKGSLLGVRTDCGNQYTGEQHPAYKAWKKGAREAGHVSLRDFTATCRELPCHSLQLIGCKFNLKLTAVYLSTRLALARGGSLPHLKITISRERLQRSSDYDLGCAMWDALESGLPVASDKEQQHLSRWLAAVFAGQVAEHHIEPCCTVLCGTQSVDSRPRSHWCEKKWCVDGLAGLRLDKLSRIALLSLMKVAKYFSPDV